jgi:hypothetical protein
MGANIITLEGTVENGQIKLPGNVRLPEKAKVYVVIPGIEAVPAARIASPRLAFPEQAADFEMQVRDASDAGL